MINLPTITYNSGSSLYDALCCALSYNSSDYNWSAGDPPDLKYSLIASSLGDELLRIGTPSASFFPEPLSIFNAGNTPPDFDFDGESDLDILLVDVGGNKATIICSNLNTATIEGSITTDLKIVSAFTKGGAGEDYILNVSAITAAGAALWGGDGAGGERTTPDPDGDPDTIFSDRRDEFENGVIDESWEDANDAESARMQESPPYVDYIGDEIKRGLGDEIKANPITNSPEDISKK